MFLGRPLSFYLRLAGCRGIIDSETVEWRGGGPLVRRRRMMRRRRRRRRCPPGFRRYCHES